MALPHPGHRQHRLGPFVGQLRLIHDDGPISIEHEDSSLGCEQGFLMGKRYLESVIAG